MNDVVALSGFYGFGNAGDEALLDGLVAGLHSLGRRPLVLSADPVRTSAFHGVPAAHRLRGLPVALLRSGSLISGGGGLLQDRTSSRSLRYYLAVITAARLLGRRVVVYGQSIGPLSDAGKRLVARAVAGLPVAVRDRASQELLSGLGIPSHLVGDPALLLRPPEGVAKVEGRLLVLIPRAGQPELNAALIRLGREWRDEGEPVEILALHPNEDREDAQEAARAVPGAVLTLAPDHRHALERVAAAAVVASARLHGLIFATVCDVPSIGLVYDPKVAGYLAESGGVGFSPPVEVDSLVAAARSAVPLVAARRAALLERARSGVDWLAGALAGEAT